MITATKYNANSIVLNKSGEILSYERTVIFMLKGYLKILHGKQRASINYTIFILLHYYLNWHVPDITREDSENPHASDY